MFILQKCMKKNFGVGAAAHRGTAVEKGIALGLETGASNYECIQTAMEEFTRLTAMSGDPKKEKEREAISSFVIVGLDELRPYGKPTSTQGAIKYEVEGLDVPFIGFYDFEWEDKGILVDLKTTHALPSKISTNHARQVALYVASRGDNLEARISYVTPKKSASYVLENGRDHVNSLIKIGLTIQRFLSLSDDPLELASFVTPDVDSFYVSDPVARKAVYDIWGL